MPVVTSNPIQQRLRNLETLLGMFVPCPTEWATVAKKVAAAKSGHAELELLPCHDYKTLLTAWRRAMKWTDGLDHALTVMLASVISTKSVGDQLWIKVIGPASCLDAETPIYDPTDDTIISVSDRCELGTNFSVFTLKNDGRLGIADALPPVAHDPQPMYLVTFASGKAITVTGGHRFWNGVSYVETRTIADALCGFGAYHLPTISASALSTQMRDAHRSMRTTGDSQSSCCACPYRCDGQPHYGRDNGRCAAPLLADAPTHIQRDSRAGGPVVEDRYTLQRGDLPSMHDAGCRAGYGQSEDESELRHATDTYGQCGSTLLDILQLLQETIRLHKLPPSVQFSATSTYHYESQSPLLRGNGQQWCSLYGADCNTLELSRRQGNDRQSGFSESEAMASSALALFQRRQAGDISVLQETQPSSTANIRPTSIQTGTIRQLAYDALQTKVQPSLVSVNMDRTTLDPSILSETDSVVNIEYVGDRPYYDFHVPETRNYWACGCFHHNSGKSTLCEAITTCKDYVIAKSTLRGFHSGTSDETGDDYSLITKVSGKTLVTKDGDTLLQSPNLSQILSEARDLYDTVSRSSYRTRQGGRDYAGIRMTWLLCGTSSLRSIDSSELGERFLDCVIMEGIDDELEDEVLWRVANRAERALGIEADGTAESYQEPEMTEVMQLTGGYVKHLRENAMDILSQIDMSDDAKRGCTKLGKFVAYMRARPSTRQDETAEREFAARLVSQHIRLAKCLAAVLNKPDVDAEVMARTRRVALDTGRGQTLEIVKRLFRAGEAGLENATVAIYTATTPEKTRTLLRFLRQIGVAEPFEVKTTGMSAKHKFRLTERLRKLYVEVCGEGL